MLVLIWISPHPVLQLVLTISANWFSGLVPVRTCPDPQLVLVLVLVLITFVFFGHETLESKSNNVYKEVRT